MEHITRFIADTYPNYNVMVTECRLYPFEGWLVHYSLAEVGTVNVERDLVGFIGILTDNPGGMTLRWAHAIKGVEPVRPDENIGSCEPGPDLRKPLWDKTGKTWHTDVDKVGRYSVRRPGLRQDYRAYLNGEDLNLMPSNDPEVLKRSIDRRILEARRINHVTDKLDDDLKRARQVGDMARAAFGKR